ncbi:MAG: ketoacyl-ACP synthase III [Phototrophicaceae bacterium]
MRVRIAATGYYLPEQVYTSQDVIERIRDHSPHKLPFLTARLLEMATGIKERRYLADDEDASDLAVGAVRKMMAVHNIDLRSIDALIFASASHDVSEPATAHIVQHKLGLSVPVFDVKNACNSFLNGIQVGEAFVQSGQYRRVLVCNGESPSRFVRWQLESKAELREYMAGLTFGDAGAAVLLEPSHDETGIFYRKFESHSHLWDIGGVFAGGSRYTRDLDYAYFRGNSDRLREAFEVIGASLLDCALQETGLTYADFQRVMVHQVTMSFLDLYLSRTGIPRDKVEITLPTHGNMAAASMGVAFAQAVERGAIQRGDHVLFTGLAGGVSLGVMMVQY